ncbi:Fic family protein [Pseudomonas sp. UBA6562]|uniref:Fic family protein n=1 Tax=Pseudomonas sp. UBA6562 TaxID=1947332 RepID=UPI0025D356B3|nr:Fic family protein [Pseudomonas sp. UBA6562]
MGERIWIWQQPEWPDFQWRDADLAVSLRQCVAAQGQLLGKLSAVDGMDDKQAVLDTLLSNIVTSSAIEGEQLNVESVRSSLAKRLGVEEPGRVSARSEGVAQLMLDATQGRDAPLTTARLFTWHRWLFAEEAQGLSQPMRIGALRGHAPMQVVSGRLDRPTVHFQAPPREGLEQALDAFLDWFARSRGEPGLDPLLRAGIAHFWFVTLHLFDDGNGRLTRALTDLALAQGDGQAIRFYTMAASILDDRAGYYAVLESSQKDGLDITPWLSWFLETLLRSLQQALARIDRVLAKARFWQAHREEALLPEQVKVLNRLLDGGAKGFEGGISAAQYQAVAKVSKATATRHLVDLLDKGCLLRLPGGGRNTRYHVALP